PRRRFRAGYRQWARLYQARSTERSNRWQGGLRAPGGLSTDRSCLGRHRRHHGAVVGERRGRGGAVRVPGLVQRYICSYAGGLAIRVRPIRAEAGRRFGMITFVTGEPTLGRRRSLTVLRAAQLRQV